ncbi:MAG: hypothetical protein L0Z55_11070 [Planctomycetes bacterium]|nr:hypothetical protein [Planctomycetota bacterium]
MVGSAGREEEEARIAQEKAWQDEQAKRIELIESMSKRERRSTGAALASSPDRVRNYNPGAITRFRKLRALSRFMLLGAYLFLPLILCGLAACVYLYRQSEVDPAWLVLATLGWTLLLLFAFFLFKFLGEMSWLLADLGDHQLDVRNLLLDLREYFDRLPVEQRPR